MSSEPMVVNNPNYSTMFRREYILNNISYLVDDIEEVHDKLSTDYNFLKEYIELNTNNLEITRVQDENMEESNTKIIIHWCRKTTHLLWQTYKERFNKFRDPKVKKKDIWLEIVKEFEKYGYNVNTDILNRKMRNMRKTYRTIKDNNSKSATGRGRITWDYYDLFNDMFEVDKTINFGPTISSRKSAQSATLSAPHPPTRTNLNNLQSTELSSPKFINSSSSVFIPTTPIIDFADNLMDDYIDGPDEPIIPYEMESITSRAISANPTNSQTLFTTPQNQSSTPSTISNNNENNPVKNPTPSTISNNNENNPVKNKSLYNFRKQQLELENKRVEAIKIFTEKIDETNKIQAERNKLLELLIKQNINEG